jgi:hypothetical protein
VYRIGFWASGAVSAALAMLVGCSIDDRDLDSIQVGSLLTPEAGAGVGGAAASLAVEPLAIDFGGAVVGAPSRARVAIVNEGGAPLDKPVASLLTGSDPDYVILHNQCENDIPAAGRCDVRLQLVPSKEGGSSAALAVQSSGQSTQVAIAGSGLAAGPLTVTPSAGSSTDFGGVALAATLNAEFDVSNPTADPSGPLAISVNEAQFRLLPPQAGDCQPGATTLVSGERCRVRVGFTPDRRGGADATLLVTSAIGSTALPLAGTGLAPASLQAPEVVDFGGVVLQSVGLRTLLVENVGDSPLQLGGVALAGAEAVPEASGADASVPGSGVEPGLTSAFSVQNSDCGAGKVLAGGDHCHVTVGFRPLNVAPNQQTTVVVSAAGGVARNIALTGNGLSQGSLVLAAAPGAPTTFGQAAIGQSLSQDFVITNPSSQPSGVLEIRTNDDFVVAAGMADGHCQTGVTSLVNGQSCAISIIFTPSARGQRDGGLLVTSVLAGAAYLPLEGLGLALPEIGIAREELDFGRVPVETSVQQTLTVVNRGDQPLSSVRAVLEGPGGGGASSFSLLGECSGALTAGASCDIGLQFLPSAASSYAAVLRLSSETGGSTSALLLGRAFPRGSLVMAAVAGSTDFGDVAIGSSRMLSFTLMNPGNVPSGRLSLSSSSNAFTIAEGECNPEGTTGLANGDTCTFTVTFSPTTSDALTVNLAVQSPGAGETALTLTGRGRTAPNLTATGNRDFGSASVNQDALTSPLNQFTWTLTNEGDLESGPLQVVNSNGTEFITANDTCANVSLAGHATCTIDVRFRPSSTGVRAANLDVTDSLSSRTLRLAMTGNGILVAAPGESCVNATCSSGVCTGGVCCDRECLGSCQVCSDTGVCTDQAERQQCGTGNGECFGVNQCLLPELEVCSGDDQCGSSNCERRLGGGPMDRICCLDDCGTSGQQCNPQTGRCQVPSLGSGAACGAAGQAACGAGLECKACLNGGRQCTAPDLCCGGCGAGYTCVDGACDCPVGSNGQPQLDCGGGQCILDRANACCASSPTCPAGLPFCDGQAGLCRACLQASDCPAQAGAIRSCTNFTCVSSCNTQQGFKDCNGTCIANTACCGGCGAGQTCVSGQCRIADGGTCTQGGVACNSGNCSGGRCCAAGCTNGCTAQGTCNCPGGQVFARGACRGAAGQPCSIADDCADGCTQWFEDRDGDGFGNPDAPVQSTCGNVAPSSVFPLQRDSTDCCDSNSDAKPGQTGFFNLRLTDCPRARDFDYNCDGFLQSELPATDFAECEGPVNTACAQRSGIWVGEGNFAGATAAQVNSQDGLQNFICGNSSVQYSRCTASGADCTGVFNLSPRCR